MRLRRTLATVASALALSVALPAVAGATDQAAPAGAVTASTPVAEPAAEPAAEPVAEPVAGSVAGPVAATVDRVAIPVLRGNVEAPFLLIVHLPSFGVTMADVQATRLPLVPLPGEDGNVLTSTYAPIAVPEAEVLARLTAAKTSNSAASDEGALSVSEASATSTTSTGRVTFPISVYVDASNDTALERNAAANAWSDTFYTFRDTMWIDFSVVRYQNDAVAFLGSSSEVRDVQDDCQLQRFGHYENMFAAKSDAVLVFSAGQMAATGYSEKVYGLAIDGPVSRRWSRGESKDFCTGAWASPSYMPVAHASTDFAWAGGINTERQAPSHWAAHEVAHMFGMDHNDAGCDGDTSHQHQSLEAATSDKKAGCSNNIFVAHYHWGFTYTSVNKMKAEAARWADCKVRRWCTSDATPSAPQSITLTPGDRHVVVSWTAPEFNGGSAVADYCVFYSQASYFQEGQTGVSGGCGHTGLSTQVNNLTNGTSYTFMVRAQNTNGSTTFDKKGPQTPFSTTKPGTAPAAPVLNPIGFGNQQLTLSWSTPANGGLPITNYRVYRTATFGGTKTLLTSGGCANLTTQTSCTDSGLQNGTSYYYEVTAVNLRGESARSNEQWNTPRTVPSAPVLESATPGDGQVALQWTEPSNGGAAISAYEMYRGTSPGGSKTLITTGGCANLGSWLRSCTDTVANGTTYYYQVKARNNAGLSAFSNERSAMPTAPPTTSPSFSEDWSSGIGGWTVAGSGATSDCAVGQSGCSLKLNPPAGNAGVQVSKTLNVTMGSPTTVSFWFRGDKTYGDTDSNVQILFNGGTNTTLQITEPSSNNGVALYGSNSSGVFTSWPNANAWYQAVVTINPSTDTATAQIKDAFGANVGGTGSVTIASAATTITGLSYNAWFWGGTSAVFNYDTVRVTGGVTSGFSESWNSGIGSWAVAGSGATSDCAIAQNGCSLKLNPPVGSAGVQVSKSLNHTMASPTTVSYWFRGDKTYGDTDSNVQVLLNGGANVTLQITEPSSNNGVALYGTNSTGSFFTWTENTWYQAVITINPSTDTAFVQIKNASGTVVATSGNVAIASTATTITGLSFNAWFWGGTADVFHYDTVAIA